MFQRNCNWLGTNCFRISSKSLRKLATVKEIATDWEQIVFELVSKSLRKLATFKEIETDWEQIAFELAVNR